MTELVVKVDDKLADRFREIALKKFHGDNALAFEYALKLLMSDEERQMLLFEQIVEQIQEEIESSGGVSEKDIDAYISAYRRKKIAARGK